MVVANDFLLHLDTYLDADALVALRRQSYEPLHMAFRLSLLVPEITPVTFDPSAGRATIQAAVIDLVEAMTTQMAVASTTTTKLGVSVASNQQDQQEQEQDKQVVGTGVALFDEWLRTRPAPGAGWLGGRRDTNSGALFSLAEGEAGGSRGSSAPGGATGRARGREGARERSNPNSGHFGRTSAAHHTTHGSFLTGSTMKSVRSTLRMARLARLPKEVPMLPEG